MMPTPTNADPKRPTLSQQVKMQAVQIEQLTGQLQQKEEELATLAEQANATQTEIQGQLQQKEKQIEQLTAELNDKLATAETQLTDISGQQHMTKSENIINLHIIAGMAFGLLPVPLLDIAALTGVQLNLLRSLCRHYDVEFNEQKGKAFVHALISGAAPVVSVVGLSSMAKLIPAIGTIGGGIGMVIGAGVSIYAVGQVFVAHFRAGGTLQNFSAEQWKTFFKGKLQEGKGEIRHRIQDVKHLARTT